MLYRCRSFEHVARNCPRKSAAPEDRTYASSCLVQDRQVTPSGDPARSSEVPVDDPEETTKPNREIEPEQSYHQNDSSSSGETTVSQITVPQQPQQPGRVRPRASQIPRPREQRVEHATPATPAFARPRGKSRHASPDDEGFVLATGKHTLSATVVSPMASSLTDRHIAWMEESATRERQRFASIMHQRRSSH